MGVTFRVNTLKSNVEKVKQELQKLEIEFDILPYISNVFIIKNAKEKDIQSLEMYEKGIVAVVEFYNQYKG